jgi:hypothetical protein
VGSLSVTPSPLARSCELIFLSSFSFEPILVHSYHSPFVDEWTIISFRGSLGRSVTPSFSPRRCSIVRKKIKTPTLAHRMRPFRGFVLSSSRFVSSLSSVLLPFNLFVSSRLVSDHSRDRVGSFCSLLSCVHFPERHLPAPRSRLTSRQLVLVSSFSFSGSGRQFVSQNRFTE